VYLTDVNLMCVHLMGAHLIGMHFIGIYLISVHLTGVRLTGVPLMGVYLTGVCLIGVHFTGVYASLIAEVINTEVACGCNLPAEVACPETFRIVLRQLASVVNQSEPNKLSQSRKALPLQAEATAHHRSPEQRPLQAGGDKAGIADTQRKQDVRERKI
jgi:hypothetical protein